MFVFVGPIIEGNYFDEGLYEPLPAAFEIVIAKPPIESRRRDTKDFRSLAAMPPRLLERRKNLLALNVAQRSRR